jgi:excisionase family DNA binding protein
MNKKEAAAMLGISTRALENRVRNGHLTQTYEKGATGEIAVFNDDEIKRLRDELDRKRGMIRPAVAWETSESRELMRGYGSEHSGDASLALFARLIEAARGASGNARPSVSVESKLTLKLDEAAALSGLSRGMLREAVAAGKLKAKIIGRAWRIKRGELEAYIEKL